MSHANVINMVMVTYLLIVNNIIKISIIYKIKYISFVPIRIRNWFSILVRTKLKSVRSC